MRRMNGVETGICAALCSIGTVAAALGGSRVVKQQTVSMQIAEEIGIIAATPGDAAKAADNIHILSAEQDSASRAILADLGITIAGTALGTAAASVLFFNRRLPLISLP